ncbi:MAG: hypothetical protein A3A24_03935 [Candidatus Buchananbacteria bacterium RIFCSPLOWO2_01_FULL_46_12]|uniref:Prolipoprotein diacylglyceryl transferase n=2 Tax=Candidatus Buchananiibacteriota TaxID=1817903 RepID=A0A1G1YU14_9BACT|nr:MAG: hypothetical protein A2744_01435 [Candidatus Buchananbacteria bacterium RIFCSPHIGHO2_01_FULL_44_11]OGY55852.1 MAG: hypothetical protein A3A24_03935 [Candidatus Buchananbacteria bacterium RIFCSPLOWO2_01_FULL_46_12]
MLQIFDPNSSSLFSMLTVDFIRLILSLIWIVLALRIVWRVEKKLDTFFKFLAFAGILIFIRQFFRIIQDLEIIRQGPWFTLMDLIPTVLVIWGLVVVSSLITKLDKEKE